MTGSTYVREGFQTLHCSVCATDRICLFFTGFLTFLKSTNSKIQKNINKKRQKLQYNMFKKLRIISNPPKTGNDFKHTKNCQESKFTWKITYNID